MKLSWTGFAGFLIFFVIGLLAAALLSIVTQNLLRIPPMTTSFFWLVLPVCFGLYGARKLPSIMQREDQADE